MQKSSPDTSGSITARVTRGFLWNLLSKGCLWGTKLLKLVVVARFLEPSQLGLFGVVVLAVQALQIFSTTGVKVALIRREDAPKEMLDQGWSVRAVRGCALGLVLSIAAPLVASFFELPQVVPLLRVMAVVPVLAGFGNIGVVFFNRQLDFRRLFLYNGISELTGFVVAVILIWKTRSVWALVWSRIAVEATRLTMSYVLHTYRPRARWSTENASELFRFGRWIFGSVVVTFLATNLDDAVVGKVVGAGALGLYQIAYRFSDMPLTQLGGVVCRVMLPAYARIQNEPERLARGFLKAVEAISALIFPLALTLALVADELVVTMLGEQWRGAVAAIQILALTGSLRSLLGSGTAIFLALGKGRTNFMMKLMGSVVMAVAVVPLTATMGITGTALAVGIGLVAMMYFYAKVMEVAGVRLKDILTGLRTGLLLSALCAGGVWAGFALPFETGFVRLGAAFAGAGLFYAVGVGLATWWMGTDIFLKTISSLTENLRGGK